MYHGDTFTQGLTGGAYDPYSPDRTPIVTPGNVWDEYHRDEWLSNQDWTQGEEATQFHVVAYYPESMKHSPLIGCVVFTSTNPYTADRVRDTLRMRVARTNTMYFTHDNAFTHAM